MFGGDVELDVICKVVSVYFEMMKEYKKLYSIHTTSISVLSEVFLYYITLNITKYFF